MRETADTYNGWTNYATWRVNLEICDDLVASMVGEQTFTDTYSLSQYLQETTEELVTGDDYRQEHIATQYAMAFISDVNWYEIADHAEELIEPESDDEDADDSDTDAA